MRTPEDMRSAQWCETALETLTQNLGAEGQSSRAMVMIEVLEVFRALKGAAVDLKNEGDVSLRSTEWKRWRAAKEAVETLVPDSVKRRMTG